MVDKAEILDQVIKDFDVGPPSKTVSIRPDGTVDVSKSVEYEGRGNFKVKFGEVVGDFYCKYSQLTSLEGSPEIVDGDFVCSYNDLTNLQGAPLVIGGNFTCVGMDFESLVGFPSKIGGQALLSYHPKLPLLRLLNAHSIGFTGGSLSRYKNAYDLKQVEEVLNEFAGQGKRGVPACMVALNNLQKELGLDLKANMKW